MHRSILSILCLSLLSVLPAAAQQTRPSMAAFSAAQKRTNDAICAKADADGDSYRPFVCDPRCDCLAPFLLQAAPSSCDESAPGVFDIAAPGAPTCSNGYCAGVGGNFCTAGTCPSGQTCVSSCAFSICISRCALPCSSSATCPPVPGPTARLTGVSPPDSPNAVECLYVNPLDPLAATPSKINSNDAIECLEQVQASAGPCQ